MFLEIEIYTKYQKVILETISNGKVIDWQKFKSLDELMKQQSFYQVDWMLSFNSTSSYIRLVATVKDVELPSIKEVKKQVSKCSVYFELESLFNAVRNRLGYHSVRLDDWHYSTREEYEDKDVKAFMDAVYKRYYKIMDKFQKSIEKSKA